MSRLNDYIAIVSADIYLEDENETIEENTVLTNISSYASAVELIEEYYGNSLSNLYITLIDGPFLHINNDTIDKIMTNKI